MAERRSIGPGLWVKGAGRSIYGRTSTPRWAWTYPGGRRELVRSLRTDRYHVAEERREVLVEAVEAAFTDARREIEAGDVEAIGAALEAAGTAFDARMAGLEDDRRDPRRPGAEDLGQRVRELEDVVARLTSGPVSKPRPAGRPLRELVDAYLRAKPAHQYRVALTGLLERLPDGAGVADVTFDVLEGWAAEWQAEGRTLDAFMRQRARFVRHAVGSFGLAHGMADAATAGEVSRWMLAAGMRLDRRAKRNGADASAATFTADELARVLSPDFAEVDRFDRGHVASKLARTCAPVIAALSGLRREEIGAMRVSQVREVQGTRCFVIEPTPVFRPKTSSSERPVPVHAALRPVLELLVAGKDADDYVLDGLRTDARGVRGAAVARVFGWRCERVLGLEEVRRRRLSFHSLRRWAAASMFAAGVEGHVRDQVLGHSRGTMRELYQGAAKIERLAEAVEAIDATAVEPLIAKVKEEAR